MVRVEFTDDYIRMEGHAESEVVCAMVSSVCTMVANGIVNYLQEDIVDDDISLDTGGFYLNKKRLSEEAKLLINVFEYGIHGLARDYPNSFNFLTEH